MRFNERSFVVLVAGLLVVAIAGVLVWSSFREDDPGATPTAATNVASSLEGGPDEVLLMSGTTLVRRNVAEQTEDLVTDIPSPNVYAAPGSSWLAYVTSKQGDADDDFATRPVLHLYDVDTEEEATYGAGVGPVWNPAGTHVAFLKPVEPRDCLGETCNGKTRIGIVEAETGEEVELLEARRYSILGWLGDRVLVSDFDAPTRILSVSEANDPTELDLPPSQFWGASPDGRWIVKTTAKKTEFVPVEDGELGTEPIPVDLGGHQLLEGSWSHDSTTVAAVTSLTSGTHKGKRLKFVPQDATTQILTFSPDDPEPEMIDRTYGASGTVLWDPDNDAVVFSSLLDPKRALFQARHCPLGNSEDCLIVTSWTEGVALLRAE